MGMFDGIFGSLSGGGMDLYGDMLSEQQKRALAQRGLMAAAGAFGQAAMPSRMPVPLGSVLGSAAAAMGAGQDEGATQALKAQLVGLQGQQLKSDMETRKKLMEWFSGGGLGGLAGPPASSVGAPVSAPASWGGAPDVSASSSGAPAGGWGPFAPKAVDALRTAGASDAFIQAAMGHGLAEGGFNDPWKQSGGGENSFGHWQFNTKGELPAYVAWAQGKGDPQDTALQARYMLETVEAREPGITKTADPNLAMDVIASKFERYKGHGPGQRRGYLADAQQYMSGGVVEPRMAIPEAPNFSAGERAPVSRLDAFAEQVRGRLPTLSPKYVFGTPTAPSNAGRITPPEVAGYGPRPAGDMSVIPPGYRPPLATAGAEFAQGDRGSVPNGALPEGDDTAQREAYWRHNQQTPGATLSWDQWLNRGQRQAGPVPNGAPAAPWIRPPMTPQQAAQVAAPVQFAQAGPGALAMPAAPPIPGAQGNIQPIVAAAFLADMAKMPSVGALLTGLPQYKAAQEAALLAVQAPFKDREAVFANQLAERLARVKGGVDVDTAGPIARNKAEGELPTQMAMKQFESELQRRNQAAQQGGQFGPNGAMAPIAGFAETMAGNAGARAAAEAKATEEEKRRTEMALVNPYGHVGEQRPNAMINEPIKTDHGTVIPAGSEAAPITGSVVALKDRQIGKDGWVDTEKQWAASLPTLKKVEQRALVVAGVLKTYQSGEFASQLSSISAKLKAVGLPPLPENIAGDPAKAQIAMKENFQQTIDSMKGFDANPAVWQIREATKNWANPNLQPEANLHIVAETIGISRWQEAMQNDWAKAKKDPRWVDPQDFMRVWSLKSENSIGAFVERAKEEIGPLKGAAKLLDTDIKAEADAAIAKGASRDAVINRLRERGYDVSKF